MHIIVRYLFIILACTVCMHAGQYGPNTLFQKPYDVDDYVGTFSAVVSAGATEQAYDSLGQVVPFLHNYEKESILVSFIDPINHRDSLEKIATIDFSGKLAYQCLNLSYAKNIMHKIFLGLGATIQNLNVDVFNHHIDLLVPLTHEQEHLLELFELKIPEQLNTSGILSTYLECGYNEKFTNFKALDFVQLFLRGAIITPQWVQGKYLNILQFPFTGNATFGYQMIGVVLLGLTEHVNVGFFGTVNTFQSADMHVPYNKHILENQLLIDKQSLVKYTPGSVYNGAVYWEFTNFCKEFMLTLGISSMYGTARKIKPLYGNSLEYSVTHTDVNLRLNATLESWILNAVFVELEYNFLTEKNPQGPVISLFFNTPISGFHYPKINSLGGSFGLGFNYFF
ncbi:MAG: hypothetical protein ACXWL5_02995 [Candidatus Chromulinivorax sp.]